MARLIGRNGHGFAIGMKTHLGALVALMAFSGCASAQSGSQQAVASTEAAAVVAEGPAQVVGIMRLKFEVSDLAKSLDFYERGMRGKRNPRADHKDADGNVYAYIMNMPGWGHPLDLRLKPDQASRMDNVNPLTLYVETRADLHAWMAHFNREGFANSGEIVTGLAFLVVVKDPDGRLIRLYTKERHGPEVSKTSHPWNM